MEWLTEEIDQEARPLSSEAVATKEMPDRLDALVEAVVHADVAPTKAATLRAILKNVRDSIDNALKLLEDTAPETRNVTVGLVQEAQTWNVTAISLVPPSQNSTDAFSSGDRVVEGVFDGQEMVGDDGKSYAVPPNYASKSKLVEGDMLKLTIGGRGNFIYKQIGPIERQRLIGSLAFDQETSQFLVVAGGRSWKVIKASVTYYKADAGDEAVILVPKNAPSKWAAVENIIRKKPQL
jgi:hypothetical protein